MDGLLHSCSALFIPQKQAGKFMGTSKSGTLVRSSPQCLAQLETVADEAQRPIGPSLAAIF